MPIRILHISSDLNLEDASRRIFDTLGIGKFALHESENYVGGSYYLGGLADLRVKTAIEDDEGFDDYQYWIVLDSPTDRESFESIIAKTVHKLLRAGFGVAAGTFLHNGELERTSYSLDGQGNVRSLTEIVRLKRTAGPS